MNLEQLVFKDNVSARVTASQEHFMVIDSFLTQDEFDRSWTFVQDENYQFANSRYWEKGSRLSDGRKLEGPVYFSGNDLLLGRHNVYPTDLVIDVIIQKIEKLAPKLARVIGTHKNDWDYFSARPVLYPSGCSFSWHNEEAGKAGTFFYYVNPGWNVQWGGELLISTPETGNANYAASTTKIVGCRLDNQIENKLLMSPGVGNYVFPKPNRLVLLKPGIYHSVRRIDSNAGDNVQAMITGFFLKHRDKTVSGYSA